MVKAQRSDDWRLKLRKREALGGSVEGCASGELAKKQPFVPVRGGQVPPAIMQIT